MRSARMDNFKCLLMAFVVLGHLLELQDGRLTDYLYLVIYAFHMPLFAWVCGYFAKPADTGCVRSLLLPYLVFQLLYSYLVGTRWQMEDLGTPVKLLEPYWLMWFIMALLLWRLLLPLLDVKGGKKQAVALGVTFGLSLLSGWQHELRFVLSFQRMIALLPMFLLGYYCRQRQKPMAAWWESMGTVRRNLVRCGFGLGVLVCMGLIFRFREGLPVEWMYYKYPYGEIGGNVLLRGALLLGALVWLGFFLSVMPGQPLPLLTRVGRNTLPVYLLHGLVIKWLEHREIYAQMAQPWLLTAALWAGMLLLFSSPPVGWLFRWCFGSRKRSRNEALYM